MWRSLKNRLSGWRELVLPGTLIISLVCLLRLSGILQEQEWMALDAFSRQCPERIAEPRMTLISIDADDYEAIGEFPIADRVLAQTLTSLQSYSPRVIGLDIVRDRPIGEGQSRLQQVLQSMPNVVATETVLSQEESMNVAPPPGIPPDRVGFADTIVDADGKVRRIELVAAGHQGQRNYSLALQLARRYLQDEGITFSQGDHASDPIQFGDMALPRFYPNSGGYIRAETGGNQMLMNFCMLQKPYTTIALRDLLADNVEAEQLRDRVVIIGQVDTSAKTSFITSAVRETLYSQRISNNPPPTKVIYSVEIHAHATQQIISSVLDDSCVLYTWTELTEELWIIGWGAFGMLLSLLLQSPWKNIISLAIATLVLLVICYWFLTANWWIPFVPPALALCSAGLVTTFFDRDIRFELAQRRLTVERTYEAVHNGPLQHLAAILRSSGERDLSIEQLQQQLQSLNAEMRSIFEYMRQDTATRTNSLYIADNTFLDLQQPLGDLLYQVYDHTLNQPLPGFDTVQTYIAPNFESLSQGRFSSAQKRGLCLFLQEALLNIGKHAIEATRIDVICTVEDLQYCLQIVDNGQNGLATPGKIGQGTRQAVALAQRLGGQFQRRPHLPQGTICELIWSKRRFNLANR
ncbi:MAG: CHASE2 domain-containing protein [Phormidesmis sp.]